MTLASPAGVQSSRTTIRPSVSVPVLSVARTVTEPRVSTAGSLRTRALRPAIRRAPSARLRVTTAGSDSGTAATTRLIAVTTISSTGSPRTKPRASTTTHKSTVTPASMRPIPINRRCSGVRPAPLTIMDAMRPVALDIPTAVTTARPRPRTTTVPEDTACSTLLSTGMDSPVRADSSTRRAADSTTLASAGTMSPSASTRASPTTRSAAGTCAWEPSRTTRAVGAVSSDRAVMARSARTSCTTPTEVLTTMTNMITAMSVQSPVATVSAAATSRTRISGSRSWAATRRHNGTGDFWGSRLRPSCSSRAAASADDRPEVTAVAVVSSLAIRRLPVGLSNRLVSKASLHKEANSPTETKVPSSGR